jgi:alpha-tubulin suppressor-like RCC1 family protein
VSGVARAAGFAVLALLTLGCGDSTDPFDTHYGLATLFTDVAAGARHTCAVSEGRVFCWGSDEYAQASGESPAFSRLWAVQIGLPGAAERVTAGQFHSCALLVGGQAHCWGWNHMGQLGAGEVGGIWGARQVGEEEPLWAMDAGWNHTCALAGTRALCWGSGGQGRLGDGDHEDRATPVEVAGGLEFLQVTAGGHHTCGLTTGGVAYCWGLNHAGQLGTGTAESSSVPEPVAGGHRFSQLSAGFAHTCGVLAAGGVMCWGSNMHGELGNSGMSPAGLPGSLVPSTVVRIHTLVRVEAGTYFTCGSRSDGDTWCWGRGTEGQLGSGVPIDHAVPQEIAGVGGPARGGGHLPVERLALGVRHTCGLSTVGIIFCWGTGPNGELGHSGLTYSNVPVRVDGA